MLPANLRRVFFSVDRSGTLVADATLGLTTFHDVVPDAFQKHVDMMFPDGVTRHGDQYFVTATAAVAVNSAIELLFEYVRRSRYPKRLSRFQSVFAWETLEDAERFRSEAGSAADSIWEVEGADHFRTDMRLLTMGGSNLQLSWNANQYWAGAPSSDPTWEVLLSPPVRVVRKV